MSWRGNLIRRPPTSDGIPEDCDDVTFAEGEIKKSSDYILSKIKNHLESIHLIESVIDA